MISNCEDALEADKIMIGSFIELLQVGNVNFVKEVQRTIIPVKDFLLMLTTLADADNRLVQFINSFGLFIDVKVFLSKLEVAVEPIGEEVNQARDENDDNPEDYKIHKGMCRGEIAESVESSEICLLNIGHIKSPINSCKPHAIDV